MLVGDICSRDVVSIAAGVDLANAANVMRTRHVGLLVVTADGKLEGVVSLDDLLHWLVSALSDAAGVVRREQRVERRLRA